MLKSSIFVQNELLISQEVEGEIIILNPESGDFFCLNGIASCIWPLLETGQSVDSVISLLAEGLDISVKSCETDVLAFFESMLAQDLIGPVVTT